MLKWNTLQAEGKLKRYGKNACSELNLFLCLKGKEFFKGIIRTFIQNKKNDNILLYVKFFL